MTEAPFFSPDQLTGRPGDPSLSTAEVNFDPTNKNPLQSVQNTFERLDSENAQALQQKRQQAFQQQQQERQFQQDILARTLDAENQHRENKWKQDIVDRNADYTWLNETKKSAFHQKDENGNDISFSPTEMDNEILSNSANELNKNLTAGDYTEAMSNPAFRSKMAKHEEMTRIASVKAIQLAKLKQQLAATGDPAERKALQQSIDKTENLDITKGELPDVHYPGPRISSLLGENTKDYPQQKGYESTVGADGEVYLHRPYADFSLLRYNQNDRDLLNKQHLLANEIIKQPQFQDPALFLAYQDKVNQLWAGEGKQEPFKLGVVKDGKVMPNPDPREITAAAEFMSKGGKVKYNDTEKDEADIDFKKAQAEHLRAERAGKATKPLSQQEVADQHATEVTIKRIKPIFEAKNYQGSGTPIVIGTEKDKDGKVIDKYRTVDGIPLGPALKEKGYDPKDWGVFHQPAWADAADLSGVERVITDDKGKEQRTGETDKPDRVLMLKNKQTGDVRVAYFKKSGEGKETTYDLQAFINGREAAGNAAKHKHQYKGENAALSEEINRNETTWDEQGPKNTRSNSVSSSAPVRKVLGGVTYEKDSNGKWFKII